MPDLPPDALRLVQEGAPDFAEAVAAALEAGHERHHRVPVRLTLAAFRDDPMCLYACLWYASSQGVEVRFLPDRRDSQASSPPGAR